MKKRILALSLVLMMVLTVFAGCKETVVVEDLDYDAIVMTVGENEITLREMYFMLKWNQSTYQAMASAQFGEDWYEQDLTGEGPFGDYIKDSIVTQMEEMYILCDNAEKYNMSLSEEELANLSIQEDLQVLASVVRALESVCEAKNIQHASDFVQILRDGSFGHNAFYTEELVAALVEVAQVAVDINLVELLATQLVEYGVEQVEKLGFNISYILNGEYTAELIIQDIKTILDIVNDAYDLGALYYVFDKTLYTIEV